MSAFLKNVLAPFWSTVPEMEKGEPDIGRLSEGTIGTHP